MSRRRPRDRRSGHGRPTPTSRRAVDPPLRQGRAQHTSLAFTNSLEAHGIAASHGSTGDCYDNTRMESFWATLKRELRSIHGTDRFPTRALLRAAVFDYIEAFYNRGRHQARLEHLTPTEYESNVTAARTPPARHQTGARPGSRRHYCTRWAMRVQNCSSRRY